jgi:tetratricopeptide (TPR) repeat protein
MTRRKRNKPKIVPPPQIHKPDERRHLWIVCALCAAGFLIYSNTFSSSFHFDDLLVIVNNPVIRNLWDIPSIFNAFNTRFIPGMTFAVNYALGQLDVFGYHFFNIWLHVCNAVLVYAFVGQLLNIDDKSKHLPVNGKLWIAAVVAFVFLVHPIQTQAVNYLWQRTTLLAAFFYLGTLVLYIHGRRNTNRLYYRAALAACLAAMLSKEIAFTLPLMVVLIEFLFLQRESKDKRSWFWVLPFLLMLLVIPVLLQRAEGATLPIMRPNDMTSGVAEDVMTRKDYWMTQVNALRTYLRLFIWPLGQNVDHDYPLASETGGGAWFSTLLFLLALIGVGTASIRRRPLMALGVFWFFITMSVESLVTSADILVEHRLYLPIVGLGIILAIGIYQWLYTKNTRAAMIVTTLLCLVLGALTFGRNAVWQNDLKLWTDAIEKSPRKARPYNNRGVIFKKINFLDSSLADFDRALAIKPDFAEAYYNRGGVHKMKGDLEAAARDYAKVIELEPENYQGFDARGYTFRRQGMFDQALKDFAMSIALNPRNPEVFNNRAYIYQKQGRKDLAIEDYSRAIQADPTYIYAYNNRGNLYLEKGEYERAVKDYTQAIRLKADFGEAYVNRAVANFWLGRLPQSRSDVKRAQGLRMPVNEKFLQQLKKAIPE